MEQREKLIWMLSLLMDPQNAFVPTTAADHLLANGVVVPVRCKECKRWGQHDIDVPGETDKVKACEWAFWMIGENGYCVYGEQKGGDE